VRITSLGIWTLLLLAGSTAGAQSTSSHDQERAVFGDESTERLTSVPDSPHSYPESNQAGESDERQFVDQPRAFTPAPSTAPLKLAPSKSAKRVLPVSAAEAEHTARSDDQAPDKLALRPSRKNQAPTGASAGMPSASTMIGSLAIVVGLFLLVAWVLRRGMPKQTPLLPSGILEVLGRAPLVGRQQVHLVRLGNKLLLLAITPGGIETLTEVTDPVEIDRLAGICRQSGPFSSTKAFTQLLGEFSDPQPAKRGSFSKPEPDFTGLAAVHSSTGNRERFHA
jgi:flagellar biogenesis protein FliO